MMQASFKVSKSLALVHCFQDTYYNRTGFTLVGISAEAVRYCSHACCTMNLLSHCRHASIPALYMLQVLPGDL